MKLKAILCLLALAALVAPAVADEVDDLILDLNDDNRTVREEAAKALSEIGDPRAVDPLIEALKDEHWRVRQLAAIALGEIGDPRAVDPLITALRYEDSARTALLRAFPNRWVRTSAANALGDIGDTRAVGPLTTALGDEDEYVRKASAEALEKLGAS
jgi:HEAT repeat protein